MPDVSRRVLIAVASLVPLCLATFPVFAQPPGRGLPSRNLLDRYGLERPWSNQATLDTRSDVVRYLIADEQVVIAQTRTGVLTVFDSESGVKLWDGLLDRPNQFSYPAVTNADGLYIVIGSTVYARDKYTGDELWTLRLPGPPSTAPLVSDDRLFVGTMQGSVYAYNLDRVSQAQIAGRLPQYAGTTQDWHYSTSSEIITAPVTNGNVVAFANAAGLMAVITPAERNTVYLYETGAPPSAPLELLDNSLLYAAEDYNLYCLNAAIGTTRWLYVAESPIRTRPILIDENVYLTPIDAGLFKLDVESGEVNWTVPSATRFIAVTSQRVFGADPGGNVVVIDKSDGAVLGTLPLANFSVHFANDRTDRLYLATSTGLVTCLREKGAELPVYHRFPERRPILPLFADELSETAEDESAAEEPPAADPAAVVE